VAIDELSDLEWIKLNSVLGKAIFIMRVWLAEKDNLVFSAFYCEVCIRNKIFQVGTYVCVKLKSRPGNIVNLHSCKSTLKEINLER